MSRVQTTRARRQPPTDDDARRARAWRPTSRAPRGRARTRRVAFLDAVRGAVAALGAARDDEPTANDARAASTARDDAAARARVARDAGALAATARALAVADAIAASVSELEDEDGATAKLERASASAASAAATFRTLASEDGADGRARAR